MDAATATVMLMMTALTDCKSETKSVTLPDMKLCEQIGKELGFNEYQYDKPLGMQPKPYYRCVEMKPEDFEKIK